MVTLCGFVIVGPGCSPIGAYSEHNKQFFRKIKQLEALEHSIIGTNF